MPDNIRRGRPQGKCHRERTAPVSTGARVKRCGKSAPRGRQRSRQGKPHREQNRIGATRASCSGPSSAPSPGLVARGGRRRPSQRNGRPVRSDPRGQNPAYRPTRAPAFPDRVFPPRASATVVSEGISRPLARPRDGAADLQPKGAKRASINSNQPNLNVDGALWIRLGVRVVPLTAHDFPCYPMSSRSVRSRPMPSVGSRPTWLSGP